MVDVMHHHGQGVVIETDIDPEKMARRKAMFGEDMTGSDWDRESSGVGKQMRLDIYIDDPVSLRKQADIVMEFARRMRETCNRTDWSPRTIWLECRGLHARARDLLEQAAPSQQLRIKQRKQPRER